MSRIYSVIENFVGDDMNLSSVRKFIEKLYIDTCSVIEYQSFEDPVTHITDMQEVVVHENIPCKLSHQSEKQSGEGVASGLSLSSYIILSPDLVINPGSKIVVTRNGIETAYKNSGEPARHINHQKIMLEIFKGWS